MAWAGSAEAMSAMSRGMEMGVLSQRFWARARWAAASPSLSDLSASLRRAAASRYPAEALLCQGKSLSLGRPRLRTGFMSSTLYTEPGRRSTKSAGPLGDEYEEDVLQAATQLGLRPNEVAIR